ncbi:Uu.00g081100.m01.CDS01 [Anthostomella pinea]|uniref:Uu.00g081100.m01.CDS01 n=1 Tax=Anthostomella pinea TaxID=933095 RepID=A0AAI8VL31_9PEZI|nr:Uu.00g081100.m01.CDS01 [Anthostomella pinea]
MASGAEAENQRLTIGVVTSCLALALLSFVLRIYARYTTQAKLWWDDYWMFWVMALCISMSTMDFVMLSLGSGVHQDALPAGEVLTFIKCLYAYMLMWATSVFSVKVGILLFYWRVFHTKGFRIGAMAVGALSAGIFLSNFFSFLLQCTPVSKFWDHEVEGTCIDQNTFYLASAIINVLGDVAVLGLPLPVVWKLHTSKSKKWSLSFLFLLGAFVCVASIFRIIAVTQIDPTDFTFTNVGGGLWSTVEVEVGFICANLPAIRPLLFKLLGYGTTTHSSGYGSGAKKQYGLSGNRVVARSGHFKLQSNHRDNDMQDSSTEELTLGSNSMALSRTKSKPFNRHRDADQIQPVGLSDIMVKTDIGVSVDDKESERQTDGPDHFVQISTPNNEVHLPGAPRAY